MVVLIKVINCPPLTDANLSSDIWSSLKMPSGLGCSTVYGPEEAALCAAKVSVFSTELEKAKFKNSKMAKKHYYYEETSVKSEKPHSSQLTRNLTRELPVFVSESWRW